MSYSRVDKGKCIVKHVYMLLSSYEMYQVDLIAAHISLNVTRYFSLNKQTTAGC